VESSVIVLSTGFEELYTASWKYVMSGVFTGRLEIVESHPSIKIGTVDGGIPFPIKARFVKGVFAGAIKKPVKDVSPSRKNIYIRDKGVCVYCQKRIRFDDATRDHVTPRCKGGADTWENLVLSCMPCNTRKGSKTLQEAGLHIHRDKIYL
jgi:hypothetical protein